MADEATVETNLNGSEIVEFAKKYLGYKYVCDLGPGEIVSISCDKLERLKEPNKEMKMCSFMWVYYGYPTASYEGVNVEDVTLVIRDELDNELTSIPLSTGTVDSRGRYVVTLYGLASRQMRDVVTSTVYVNNTAISATCAYSISTYAYEVATTAGMPENLIALTCLMVIYGDSAAVYFG